MNCVRLITYPTVPDQYQEKILCARIDINSSDWHLLVSACELADFDCDLLLVEPDNMDSKRALWNSRALFASDKYFDSAIDLIKFLTKERTETQNESISSI